MTFANVLCLIFIVLKILNVIAWSWWLVLAPIWGSLAIAIAVITVGALLRRS